MENMDLDKNNDFVDKEIKSDDLEEKKKKKEESFIKISKRRVSAAINQISLIGNLANKSSYEYTKEEAQDIIDALRAEVNVLEAKFMQSNVKKKKVFSFSHENISE